MAGGVLKRAFLLSFLLAVCLQVTPALVDKREVLFTSYSDDTRIGNILLTSGGFILIFDSHGRMVVNQTFSYMEHLPIKSGLNEAASMAVIDGVGYIGGRNGIIFVLQLPIDFLKSKSAVGGSSDPGESMSAEVIVSNITLPFSCITEAFTRMTGGVIAAACFSNDDNMLYILDINSPSDRTELRFTDQTYLSNILAVGGLFYFYHHGDLFRADIAREQEPVVTLENCQEAWLVMDKYHYIIVQCYDKSFVYVPREWSADAHGIKHGAWENRDVELKQCHGIGSLVFSVTGKTLTFYDTRNDYKKDIILNGSPDTSSVTCAWNGDYLTLLYYDRARNCWIQVQLVEQYKNKTTNIIPFSNGTLTPLVVDGRDISQHVLLFDPVLFLLPSAHQVFLDLHNNASIPMITDDVVVFHSGIYSTTSEFDTIKDIPTDETTTSPSHMNWSVYVIVAVIVVLIIVSLLVGVVAYKQKAKILNFFRWHHLPTQVSDLENTMQESSV